MTLLATVGEVSLAGFKFRGWAWAMTLPASGFDLIPNKAQSQVRCKLVGMGAVGGVDDVKDGFFRAGRFSLNKPFMTTAWM